MTSDHRSSSAGAASAAQQPPLQDDSLSLLTSILSHTFNVSNSYPISSSLSAVAVPPPPRPENNLTRQPIKAVMATALSQETRRRRALADQKKRREDLIAKTRKIAQVAVADDDSSGDEEDLTCIKMQMDISTTKDSSSSKPVIKASMSNQLMEHEVMVDAPRDLTTNWMLMMVRSWDNALPDPTQPFT